MDADSDQENVEQMIQLNNSDPVCPCSTRVQELKTQLKKEKTANAQLKITQEQGLEELQAQNDALMAERDQLKKRIFEIEAEAQALEPDTGSDMKKP